MAKHSASGNNSVPANGSPSSSRRSHGIASSSNSHSHSESHPHRPSSVIAGGEVSASNESTNVASGGIGRFRQDPVGFIMRLGSESGAFYSGEGWRAYQNYVGAKIFYPEYSSEIRNALYADTRIQELIENLTTKRMDTLLASSTASAAVKTSSSSKQTTGKFKKQNGSSQPSSSPNAQALMLRRKVKADVEKEVLRTMNAMVADMDNIQTIKFFAFVVHNMLMRLYHQGIHIRESEFIELKKAAEYAQSKKYSMIILPCHKSHIDYLVISYIFFRLGLALPHIAAGDNLNMPAVGWLLKHSGAFFIRRVWGDDVMYNTLMRSYIELLLERGHNIEAFIEGTRSRVGKLLSPKFGILKIILDAVLSGKVEDCIIVPMSIGYDKVIESSSYISELLGSPKQKESLGRLLSSTSILSLKWGRIDINFAKPYSLRDYIQGVKARKGPSFSPSENAEDRTYTLMNLGYRVLSDINSVGVVMPTALVGTALLTLRGRGVGRDELIRKVDILVAMITSKGGRVADFQGNPTSLIVDRALKGLKGLVGQRGDLLEPVYYPVKRFELSFYRNQVIHLFIQEVIACLALYSTVKYGGPIMEQRALLRPCKGVFAKNPYFYPPTPPSAPGSAPKSTNVTTTSPSLIEDTDFLSSLLRGEFVYGPNPLEQNLTQTISALAEADVVQVQQEVVGSETREWISLTPAERRIGRENFDFYCFLGWPFVETYWLAAVSLLSIAPLHTPKLADEVQSTDPADRLTDPSSWVTEAVLMKRAQFFGKTLYYEGDLTYFEAINKEILKNGFTRLKEMGVLIMRKGGPTTPPPLQKQPAAPAPPAPRRRGDAERPKQVKEKSGSTVTWCALHPDWFVTTTRPSSPFLDEEADAVVQELQNIGVEEKPTPKVFNKSKFSGSSWYSEQPGGRLWDLCENVGRFRREGKKRRDTATVAGRVLRLARMTVAWEAKPKRGAVKGKDEDVEEEGRRREAARRVIEEHRRARESSVSSSRESSIERKSRYSEMQPEALYEIYEDLDSNGYDSSDMSETEMGGRSMVSDEEEDYDGGLVSDEDESPSDLPQGDIEDVRGRPKARL
ncbi:acyltransferase-domain-containing protein [Cladochytrium replicatum]|nr:acyltransferase-domain-containing protein [Cladochytrium replicatum]